MTLRIPDAERLGLINSAYQKVKALQEAGFYVADALLRALPQ